jgi:hypothetical protein
LLQWRKKMSWKILLWLCLLPRTKPDSLRGTGHFTFV